MSYIIEIICRTVDHDDIVIYVDGKDPAEEK